MQPRICRWAPAVLGLCLLGSACSIRLPDGKFACQSVTDCPPEFHSCRASEESALVKHCFRQGASVSDEAGRGGAGGRGSQSDNAGRGSAVVEKSDIDAGDQPSGAAEGGSPAPTDHAGQSGGAGAGGMGGHAGETPKPGGTGGAGGKTEVPTEFKVLRSEPADGATLDDATGAISVYFSQPLDVGSVTNQTFKVSIDAAGAGAPSIAGNIRIDVDKLTFEPSARWTLSTSYKVELTSSIFSNSQMPLPRTLIQFRVRAGKWSRERVETSVQGRGFEQPSVAVSATGQVALTWNSAYVSSRHAGVVSKRLNADGSWTTLSDGSGTGQTPGILVLDDGTVVYGTNPEDSGDWQLTCLDAMGASHDLARPAGGQPSGEYIRHLTSSGSSVTLLQSMISSSAEYKVITSSCTFASPSAWAVPIAAGATVREVQSTRPGVAVWTQTTSSMELDGGTYPTGIYGVDNGGAPDCAPDGSGCPELLSPAGAIADSPALAAIAFDEVLLWHQQDSIWGRIHDSSWSAPQRVSDPSHSARAPIVSSSPGQTTALAAWIETQLDSMLIVGSALKDKTWAKGLPLSAAAPAAAGATIALANNAVGNGMAVWSQGTTSDMFNYSQFDIHAVPYTARDGWRMSDDYVLSLSHVAFPDVSVAMSPDGRAFAAWVESDAVWYGHYD